MKRPRLIKKMERDWNRRARENARYYIATGRTDWTHEEFLELGTRHDPTEYLERHVEHLRGT